MSFPGFAQTTLLEAGSLPIAELAVLACREGQRTRDIYRVHRWFARRLSTQFRSILAALTLAPEEEHLFWQRYNEHIPLDGALVLDPFVGGGTTIVEASRCGACVIGYDIDPVAASITRFELSARTREKDLVAAKQIVTPIAEHVRPYHQTRLKGGSAAEVLHHFWVEEVTCQKCAYTFELHPHYQLAWSKERALQWVFCKHCHAVHTLPLGQKRLHCSCGKRTTVRTGTLYQGKVYCPQCKHTWKLAEGNKERPPVWRLFAQEILQPTEDGFARVFKRAEKADRDTYAAAERALQALEAEEPPFPPGRLIPAEPRFDRRPLIHGISRYAELFNARQRLHLTILGRAIASIKNESVKRLLGLAFSEHLTTNCMYTGYAFGYRRTSPLFSIHGYRHIVRPVEINPWLDGIGRGTFLNSLNKIGRAIAYAKAPTDLKREEGSGRCTEPIGPEDGVVSEEPADVVDGRARAVVRTQSSADLAHIQDGSVHLVLSDPPYFDNISYSELSDFYLAWHQKLGIAEGLYRDPERSAPMAENLAATERSPEAVAAYTETLTSIFSECYRVLHEQGICVFTYHHKFVQAWQAVGKALAMAGLRCTAVLPMRGEGQGGLHSKNGTIKWDAVIVCRKGESPSPNLGVIVPKEKITAAAEWADWYAQTLGHRNVGFRKPDQQNFHLACIAAFAQAGAADEVHLPLEEALQYAVTRSQTCHA